eukprot:GHVR01094335.1.p1 GENE.GHVR01094335.1~~GHVR01094335.1.p1  ORF type:complete len:226 (-),score=37.02 GHVR01094335.1:206-808(-)
MARNAERQMAMLNRWELMKDMVINPRKGRKPPKDALECTDVKDAQYFRDYVVRNMARKISEIQNAGLGESRIRDLNDEINYLLRDKAKWEERIKELGGPDMKLPTGTAALGDELSGQEGYKYFGAAKDLPGVRELFENQGTATVRKTRKELRSHLTPDYFGWRDEEDGMLVLAEQAREADLVAEAVAEWKRKHQKTEATQ